jgi:L-threonylcarbamoyladenylate synthase
VGIESTIIDMSGDAPIILRPGIITTDQLAAVLGTQILSRRQGLPVLRAPGMHPVHYAPMTPMLVLAAARIPVFLQSLNKDDLPIALIAQSCLDLPLREHIHSVQMPIDAAAYAHDLYRTLRSLDNQHYKCILVEAVPDSPEWEAIRDRLNKASIK